MGLVVVTYWIPRVMITYSYPAIVFFGMTIIATEYDDGVIANARFIQLLEDAADLLIDGGHDSGVRLAGHFQVGEGLFEFFGRLLRIVW